MSDVNIDRLRFNPFANPMGCAHAALSQEKLNPRYRSVAAPTSRVDAFVQTFAHDARAGVYQARRLTSPVTFVTDAVLGNNAPSWDTRTIQNTGVTQALLGAGLGIGTAAAAVGAAIAGVVCAIPGALIGGGIGAAVANKTKNDEAVQTGLVAGAAITGGPVALAAGLAAGAVIAGAWLVSQALSFVALLPKLIVAAVGGTVGALVGVARGAFRAITFKRDDLVDFGQDGENYRQRARDLYNTSPTPGAYSTRGHYAYSPSPEAL